MSGVRVGYIRVSTDDQELANQRQLVQADRFFEDVYTGKNMQRPGFERMKEFLREGDTLICYSTDRLARSVVDLLRTVKEFLDRKITIEFIKEGWKFKDGLSSTEQLLLSILGICSEFEMNQLKERRAIGIQRAKAEGKYKGRKPKFTPDIYKEILRMNEMGIKKRYIAKSLCISPATVYNYISMNGEYKGYKKTQAFGTKGV